MQSKQDNQQTINILCGSITGATVILATWPMENIKTQLQTENKKNPRFSSIKTCAQYNIKHNGFLSLYRGLTPIILTNMPKVAIRFTSYNYVTNNILTDNTSTNKFMAGLMAGTIEGILVTTPAETLKTKLIISNKPFIKGTSDIIKNEGILSLGKGVVPTVMKSASNQAVRFTVYEKYKSEVKRITQQEITTYQSFLGGTLVGIISVLFNNPIDVVKTKIQSGQFDSMSKCILNMYNENGIVTFYRGTVPRLLRVVPGQGIVFMSYESVKSFITKLYDTLL